MNFTAGPTRGEVDLLVHIGGETIVNLEDLVVIIDKEATTGQIATREFLEVAQSEGRFEAVPGLTKSYVVLGTKVIASPVASVTIGRRVLSSEVF